MKTTICYNDHGFFVSVEISIRDYLQSKGRVRFRALLIEKSNEKNRF